MPVKITASTTDSQKGEISLNDLESISTTYQSDVELRALNGHPPIVKPTYCFFGKKDVEEVLKQARGKNSGLRIYFGISLPGQKSCEGKDYSNYLTVTIFATDKNGNDHKKIGDLVLTPGFKNPDGDKDGGSCCGSLYPMT